MEKQIQLWMFLLVFLSIIFSIIATKNTSLLKCLPGITKFSYSKSRRHFYQCDGGPADVPKLMECDEGQFYNMQKQKCTSEEGGEGMTLTEKAMGRNILLGSLYDFRNGMFFPEASLWNQKTLRDNSFKNHLTDVESTVNADKRTLDKMSHQDISASLGFNLMSGMIVVKGSAGFLKHQASSEEESMVELSFRTSKYSKIMPKMTPLDYAEECTNPSFTHVVTSVKYGMEAHFVLTRMVEESEEETMITGSLSITCNKIPGASISGSGGVNITDSEKEILNTTRLSMYGDFSPSYALPASFEQAVEFYRYLPLMAGRKHDDPPYQGSTIVEVRLTPLGEICGGTEQILGEIGDSMMEALLTMLDEIEQLVVKVNGLLITPQAQKFQPIKENLNLYRTNLLLYQMRIKANLMNILPNIRGGTGNGEDDLTLILQDHESSPYAFETSSLFLTNRKREILAVKFLVDNFVEQSNLAVADYESANDVQYIFKRDLVVVLDFHLLSTKEHTQSFLDGETINEEDFWYNRVDILGDVGGLLRGFWNFAMDNVDESPKGYLVKLTPRKDESPEEPCVMNALIKGYLLSNQYQVPAAPHIKEVYAITTDSVKFDILKVNPFVTGCRIFMMDVISGVRYEWDMDIDVSVPEGDLVVIPVGGLKPAHVYSFTVKYLTAVGTSPPSSLLTPFSTRPTTEPQLLMVEEVSSKQITVTWKPPAYLADPIQMEELLYKVVVTGDDLYENLVISDATSFTLLEPIEATLFTFSVSALLNRDLMGPDEEISDPIMNITRLNLDMSVTTKSLASTISVCSIPLPPTIQPVLDQEVTQTSAIVRWDPPTRVCREIVHYLVEFTATNSNGTEPLMPGTTKQLVVRGNHIELKELFVGATYHFIAKIVTTAGESPFSNGIFFSTNFDEDEAGEIRDEVLAKLDQVTEDMKATSKFCAVQDFWDQDGTITYDFISLSDNNVAEASMNPVTGTYTAGAAGTYQVLFGIDMVTEPGHSHRVWMRLNGNMLMEASEMSSSLNIYTWFEGADNGQRAFLYRLEAGDRVSLFHESDGGDGALSSITFCVTSIILD